MSEADAALGWQLQQKGDEVRRVKKISEAKVKRLATAKKILLAEVQAVKTSSQELLHTEKAKHKAQTTMLNSKVKAAQKKGKQDVIAVMKDHKAEVTKLECQKTTSREKTKTQRAQFKGMMATLESKHDLLELLCSACELESQKLAREVAAQQAKVQNLRVTSESLNEKVEAQGTDIGIMTRDLALKDDALSKAELAVAVGKGQLTRLRNKINATDQTKFNMRQKIKVLQKQNQKLEASLMAATKVHACVRVLSILTKTLLFTGDGIQFRDFLIQHFPELKNTCIGRAE